MVTSRRVKVAYIPYIDILRMLRDGDCRVGRYAFVGLPLDVHVLCVESSMARRAFGFLLEHEMFDEVPVGEVPPEIVTHIIWKG
jgi:hypothetical protein